MDDHVSSLNLDVEEISEEVRMSKKSGKKLRGMNVSLCGQKMNREIFLAQVRYLLVCNLTWQAL